MPQRLMRFPFEPQMYRTRDTINAKRVVVIVVVVVVVLILTRITKSVVTGLELKNTPGKKHKQTKGGTRIHHS